MSSTAFNTLPIELNKAIAHYLDADKDIATYRRISRATNNAIDADRLSFWRAKFREKYAFKEGVSNERLQRVYQRRSRLLRRGIKLDFFRGHVKREREVLMMLKDMIIAYLESFQGDVERFDEHGHSICKNQIHLLDFVLNSKLLMSYRRAPDPKPDEPACVSPLLAAIKIICSQFLFARSGAKHNIFALEESQHAVYMPTEEAPIYLRPSLTDVNMEWVLHCLNFFRHHMMNKEAQTLFDKIHELEATQKPSAWREPLRHGARALSRNWKGTYSFLENGEQQRLRTQEPGKELYIDKNIDEGKIQSLELDFITDGREMRWPIVFEKRLQSLREVGSGVQTQGRSIKSAESSIQFVGTGEDLDDDYNAIGWLNPLPPQCGIPGWQRITFMKHFMDDFDQVEQDNLWAYEGVVLPGGRIILGRWWYASEHVNFAQDYNGPFILWAVDEPEMETDTEEQKDE